MSNRLKILGITINSTLTFENHVNDVVKACGIVGYRINYCNALLFGATNKVFDKIQRVQNNLASFVNNVSIRQLRQSELNSLDLLRSLHWLPIRSRIEYKVSVLGYKGYRFNQPSYLTYAPSRLLRSTTQDQLVRVPSHTRSSSRRFSCAAPYVWNNPPASIRSAPSVDSFKMPLKTHLYRLYFQ